VKKTAKNRLSMVCARALGMFLKRSAAWANNGSVTAEARRHACLSRTACVAHLSAHAPYNIFHARAFLPLPQARHIFSMEDTVEPTTRRGAAGAVCSRQTT